MPDTTPNTKPDNETRFRLYDADTDAAAVTRIWYECGWVDSPTDDRVKTFFSGGVAEVALLNGDAECAVHATPGTMRHTDHELPLWAISAVTTSRIARKQGYALKLTARQLARGAEQGCAVAALGMFDQGFYDLLGFGNGTYDHAISFNPTTLKTDVPFRPPVRLTTEDAANMHKAMLKRQRGHGAVNLYSASGFEAELKWSENGFGLGYETDGELSHFLWMEARGEFGPYRVLFMAYQSTDQLVELLGVIKALGDQVSSVSMMEPPEVQLQALLRLPFRTRRESKGSQHQNEHRAVGWWQFRLLDVAAGVAALSIDRDVEFNARITDPVGRYLETHTWQGAGGDFHIQLGATSHAAAGHRAGLPLVECSIGAFTRLIFGAAPASSLRISDAFECPDTLTDALDRAIRLPCPSTTWDF